MVPGKKMEANEGMRLLTGKAKIDIPLKKKEEPVKVEKPKAHVPETFIAGPIKSKCVVEENGRIRTFVVTTEPITTSGAAQPAAVSQQPAESAVGEPVFHAFAGSVDVADILVKLGDNVTKGQVVAQIEAMKAKHDIKSPKDGVIDKINVNIGDEIDSSTPLVIIK